MENGQGKRLTDQELARKLAAIKDRVIRAQKLLESAQAKFEEAERHRARARELRRAINS